MGKVSKYVNGSWSVTAYENNQQIAVGKSSSEIFEMQRLTSKITFNSVDWTDLGDLSLKIKVGPDSVWRIKADHTIESSSLRTKSWSRYSTIKALDIGLGSAGEMYYIDNTERGSNTGNSIFYYDVDQFILLTPDVAKIANDTPFNPVQINVDLQGNPWVLDVDGKLYHHDNGDWILEAEEVTQMSMGGSATNFAIWTLNSYGEPVQLKDTQQRIHLTDAVQTSTQTDSTYSFDAKNPTKRVRQYGVLYSAVPYTCAKT